MLTLNSYMAKKESRYVQRLLLIHHQYAALLNLKNAVNRQLSAAQEIFIYGKSKDESNFEETTELVREEAKRLFEAVSKEMTFEQADGQWQEHQAQGQQRIIALQHEYEDILREMLLMTRLIKVGRKSKAQDHFNNKIRVRFIEFFDQIDSWIEIHRQELVNTETGFISINLRQNNNSMVALSAILVVVLVFSGMIAYLLGPRLRQLLRGTERIARGDFSTPVPEKGNDEFSQLSKSMNLMMSDLSTSRKKLLEQSYYSGMADMVSGTLHNLRNALSPVIVDLEIIEKEMGDINLKRLHHDADELGSSENNHERKQDLLEFLKLSLENLEGSIPELASSLASVRKKIDVVEKVLNEHSRFADMERPLEKLPLVELFNDALGLVKQGYLDSIPVIIDDSVTEIGTIVSQRIVLVQVLANLVNNGLESILRAGKDDGELVITAKVAGENQKKVHLQITDNGEGIEKTMLNSIFERGISSKDEGYGLGLHWCANSVASLEGKLYAASEGKGKGAVLHLIL